jgi:hypothetical protein
MNETPDGPKRRRRANQSVSPRVEAMVRWLVENRVRIERLDRGKVILNFAGRSLKPVVHGRRQTSAGMSPPARGRRDKGD